MGHKCEFKINKPREDIDLKIYKRKGQDGSITYSADTEQECRKLKKKLEKEGLI